MLNDFPILENIVIWSDVVNIPTLDRRDTMVKVPAAVKGEFERTRLSQNVRENVFVFYNFAEHIKVSKKLEILHLVGMKISDKAYSALG